jgi:hypothetical protein
MDDAAAQDTVDPAWRPLSAIQAAVVKMLLGDGSGLPDNLVVDPQDYLSRPCQLCGGGCGGFELNLTPAMELEFGDSQRMPLTTETLSGDARDALGQYALLSIWLKGSKLWFLTSVDVSIVADQAAFPHRWHWQQSPDQLDVRLHWT